MTKELLAKRLSETSLWLNGKGPAPHWRTQKYLFDNGYIDFTPTGFTYATAKFSAKEGKEK